MPALDLAERSCYVALLETPIPPEFPHLFPRGLRDLGEVGVGAGVGGAEAGGRPGGKLEEKRANEFASQHFCTSMIN